MVKLYYRLLINFFNLHIKISTTFFKVVEEDNNFKYGLSTISFYLSYLVVIVLLFFDKYLNINIIIYIFVSLILFYVFEHLNSMLINNKLKSIQELRTEFNKEYKFAIIFLLILLFSIPIVFFYYN